MKTHALSKVALSCLFFAASTQTSSSAIFRESGGIVVVEAEHFDSRATDPIDDHHWHIVPDDDGTDFLSDFGDPPFFNFRGTGYLQSLPDSGQNQSAPADVGTEPSADYKVQINTPGAYRLWLRWGGFNGDTDSMYAEIVELRDGPAGAVTDWYRFARNIGTDFAGPWHGSGGPELNNASGGDVPAVWNIPSGGTYTIRIGQREDGSVIDALILQLTSLPDPGDPGPPESDQTTSFITFVQQPADATVATNQTATFTVQATGSAPPTLQWQRAAPGSTNFANIPGATGTNITTAPATVADDGTRYRAVATIPGLTNSTRAATLTVDVTPPELYRAVGSSTFDRVTVTFSEPVGAASATAAANYTIAGLTISSATLGASGRDVILATSQQTTNANYTVTVRDVRDQVGNTLTPNPSMATFRGFLLLNGAALHKYWTNITPNNIAALTGDPRFPDAPSFTTLEPAFEYPPNGGNEAGSNYGNQLTALLRPPVTGDYIFYCSGDDPVELYLSTNEDPLNKTLIASEPQWNDARQWLVFTRRSDPPENVSFPIPLTANQFYFIEALHTEGGGGDSVGATWQLPGVIDPPANGSPPIQGEFLWTFQDPDKVSASVRITSPTDGATFPVGSPIPTSAEVTDTNGPARKVEFLVEGTKVGEDSNVPYNATWTPAAEGRFFVSARALDRRGFEIISPSIQVVIGNPPPEVLYVSGALTPSDIEITNRLAGMGLVVRQIRDTASTTADANGKVLVITSSTSNSGDVTTDYRDVPIPVINWEQALQDDFLFTLNSGGVDRDTLGGQSEVVIVTTNHPMAAGLSGQVTVVTAPSTFSWGVPATNAIIIATLAPPEDPSRAVIYGFEKGDTLINGVTKAAARRVHLFLENNTFEVTTDEGKKLFDAAVNWALGRTGDGGEGPRMSISRSGANLVISWSPSSGTLESADAVAGPWNTVTGATSPHSVTPTANARFYRVRR